ncbi:hypothetical protein LEMLEM_LOCUS879, partial [Lemmus lemmus]
EQGRGLRLQSSPSQPVTDTCLLTSLKKQMPSVSGMTDDRMPLQPHHRLSWIH